MPQTHPVHQAGNPAYADPVLRRSSPASSESSRVHDETTPFEADLPPEEFNKRMETEIGIGQLSQKEKEANDSPLIQMPRSFYDPTASEAERDAIEKEVYDKVMGKLRKLVAEVEEEQRFEQTMKKGIKQLTVASPFPDTAEIDTLLQSLMLPSKTETRRQDTGPNLEGQVPRSFGR